VEKNGTTLTHYYPYGEEQGGATAGNKEKFATYTRDSVGGLDYGWNRYYSSTWARFTSADPYVMSGGLGNPQGWNRYGYVSGDPVNYHDPSGLQMQGPAYYCEWDRDEKCIVRMVMPFEPGSGGSSGPSPSETALSRVREARNKLLDSKSLLDPDCQDLLNKIWEQDEDIQFSMTAFTDAISKADIRAAETSSDLYADLWQYSSAEAYATQQLKYGTLTIGGALNDSTLKFAAASQYHGSKVYFDTTQLLDATYGDMAMTLVHEAFHLLGFTHTDLDSAGISDAKIRETCVKN
jgi:RHS repeat-associated protein